MCTLKLKLYFLICVSFYSSRFKFVFCANETCNNNYFSNRDVKDLKLLESSKSHTKDIDPFLIYQQNKYTKEIYEPGFLIPNPSLCPNLGKNLLLLIVVISLPSHQLERQTIRETWKTLMPTNVNLGFLLGIAKPQKNSSDSCKTELDTYNDIIQSRNKESYYNLTLKTTALLEWVKTYCSKVGFVAKIDEDIFVNVPRLVKILTMLRTTRNKPMLIGRILREKYPQQIPNSKYYLPSNVFSPNQRFPNYLSGSAYVISGEVIERMYNTALLTKYIHIEDVMLTGIVREKLNIRLKNEHRSFVSFYAVFQAYAQNYLFVRIKKPIQSKILMKQF